MNQNEWWTLYWIDKNKENEDNGGNNEITRMKMNMNIIKNENQKSVKTNKLKNWWQVWK